MQQRHCEFAPFLTVVPSPVQTKASIWLKQKRAVNVHTLAQIKPSGPASPRQARHRASVAESAAESTWGSGGSTRRPPTQYEQRKREIEQVTEAQEVAIRVSQPTLTSRPAPRSPRRRAPARPPSSAPSLRASGRSSYPSPHPYPPSSPTPRTRPQCRGYHPPPGRRGQS